MILLRGHDRPCVVTLLLYLFLMMMSRSAAAVAHAATSSLRGGAMVQTGSVVMTDISLQVRKMNLGSFLIALLPLLTLSFYSVRTESNSLHNPGNERKQNIRRHHSNTPHPRAYSACTVGWTTADPLPS
jgi:hypothetical protein